MYSERRFGVMLLGLAALPLLLSGFTNAVRAGPITFGKLNVIPFTGSESQGSFTYQVVSGTQWGITNNFGDPPSALSTGPSGSPTAGDEVDFYRTAGGLFTFDSFDFALSSSSGQSDQVNLIGELKGVPVEELLGVGATSETFQTMASGFSKPIDLLRVEIASPGSIAMDLDNIVLTPVARTDTAIPEPSSLALLALGGVALAGWRRWKRHATA